MSPAISSSAATRSPRSRREGACTPSSAPASRRPQRVEHEYERMGALCYFAGWDVRCARIFDRCAPADGIEPFDALVEQFMSFDPDSRAQRVFVIVDNGSAHRGKASIRRLQGAWKNVTLVRHTGACLVAQPGRDDFSIVQRKVLQPTTSPTSRSLKWRCRRSAAATSRSRSRFSGSSPARPRALLARVDHSSEATRSEQAA